MSHRARGMAFMLGACVCAAGAGEPYGTNPFLIKLDIPAPKDSAGGIIVADVTGDWREEIVVLAGRELHVYHNPARNPRPREKRLWADRNCRRLKQCHNYYSP